MMESVVIIMCLSLIGLIAMPARCAAEPAWQLYRDEDGIQLYSRPLPDSKLLELKAETVMEARIELIGVVLRDASAYPQWMSGCKRLDVVERFDDNNMITHYVQKMPWPLTDRDVVLTVTTHIDWEIGAFTVQMAPVDDPRVPPQPDLTRMRNMVGRWFVKYVDREHTRITYIFTADPAINLPVSIINDDMKEFPWKTLQAMRIIIRNPKYIEAANLSKDREILEQYIREGRFRP